MSWIFYSTNIHYVKLKSSYDMDILLSTILKDPENIKHILQRLQDLELYDISFDTLYGNIYK